jgi:hypothetical protein
VARAGLAAFTASCGAASASLNQFAAFAPALMKPQEPVAWGLTIVPHGQLSREDAALFWDDLQTRGFNAVIVNLPELRRAT